MTASIDSVGRQDLPEAFATAARKARVSSDLALQQRALFPACESLSLLLPVPSAGDQVLAEMGNFLVPGFKSLTLHGLDRISACLQQLPVALEQGGPTKAQLCYAVSGSDEQGRPGTVLVARMSFQNRFVARDTHEQLTQLAAGLDSCGTTFACSIQEAAACFLSGPMHLAVPVMTPQVPVPVSGNTCMNELAARGRDGPDDDDSDGKSSLSAPQCSLSDVLVGEHGHHSGPPPSSSRLSSEAAGTRRRPGAQSSTPASDTTQAQDDYSAKPHKAWKALPTSTDPFWMSFSPSSAEAHFALWHAEQVFLGDWLINLSLLYAVWAVMHGRWYNLAQDLPHTWWLCYTPALWVLPAVPLKWTAVEKLRAWYLAHRSAIQTAMVLHMILQHVLVLAPTLMLPHHHPQLLAEPWSSFTRLNHLAGLMITPIFNQVPFRHYLPRQILIVCLALVHLPRSMALCLPHITGSAAWALGLACVITNMLLPTYVVRCVEHKFRTNYLKMLQGFSHPPASLDVTQWTCAW